MPLGLISVHIRNCHPLWSTFPGRSIPDLSAMPWSYYPACASLHTRFGLFPVRSPLLGESLSYFLFLRVLRCFSSPRSPPRHGADDRPSDGRVVPFGNPGVKGHLRLTRAYRSLSRPSSPPGAKASTRRPNSLSPIITIAHTFSCS